MLPLYTADLSDYGRLDRIPLYVEEVASDHPEKRFHTHTFSELVLVLRGEAKHIVGGSSCTVRKGDLLVLHPGMTHGYDRTADFGIINLTYDYRKLSMPVLDGYELPLFERIFPSPGTVFNEEELCRPAAMLPEHQLSEFAESIRQLDQELKSAWPGNFYLSLAMFMEIMARIARAAAKTHESHRTMFCIGEVIEYMYRHLTEPVNVDTLVKKAKTSRRTFFRSFRKMTGCTPQEYRTQLRLKLSVELLRGSSLNIGEIALRCGFYDTNHFCRIFREHFKTTPRRFRLNIQERENRPATSAKSSGGCC